MTVTSGRNEPQRQSIMVAARSFLRFFEVLLGHAKMQAATIIAVTRAAVFPPDVGLCVERLCAWVQAAPQCYPDSFIVLVLTVVRGRIAVSRIKEQSV